MATWRRKRKRQNWGSIEYGWNTYEEATMAVAGSATAAYRCHVVWEDAGGLLQATLTAYPRTLCATVDDAILRLQVGETVTVAGSDMPALHTRLAALGVGG